MAGSTSNILFVCTANICRSPAAEYIARARYNRDDFLFASAGFLREGKECPSDLVKVLGKENVDVSRHRSNVLDVETLEAADLVLTMESSHIRNIGVDHPDLLWKAIPLKEADERLRGRAVNVRDFAQELRSRNPMDYLGDRYDVEDPYKRGKRKYKKAVKEIDELLSRVLTSLR